MKKILLIEDDLRWIDVISTTLGDMAEIRSVVSGEQAISVIDDYRPDVLILDMLLAGETGLALLNELISHPDLAQIPVVICSSVKFDEGQFDEFGVKAVLDKSTMSPEDLKFAIKEALDE